MGVGVSVSTSESKQTFTANMMQQYSGSCDVSCNNDMSNIDFSIIRSKVGSIDLNQYCTANASCLLASGSNATADVFFKAANSTSASDPQIISVLNSGVQVDVSKSKSIQDIQDTLTQLTNQSCQVTSTNQINNVDIFAYDSDITGSIQINQQGNVGGQCQLQNNMDAAAYATGSVDNCTMSGKLGKKQCSTGKGGKSLGHLIIGFAVVIVLIIVLTIIARVLRSSSKPKQAAPTPAPAPPAETKPQIQILPIMYAPQPQAASLEAQPIQIPQVQAKGALPPAKIQQSPLKVK